MKTILLTGGAGFVGSNLAIRLKSGLAGQARVVALDNLKRRGSELNLPRLLKAGVEYVHGDVRQLADLEAVGEVGAIIDCAAEPSVLAGFSGSPRYVVDTNLNGTTNCLELASRYHADFIFLSTSRVYPTAAINGLNFRETDTRFEWTDDQKLPGASSRGLTEEFTLEGTRSLYGATKFCSELLVREYLEMYGLRGVINRCGVISGPWQMGKADQGVVVLWLASHLYGRPLNYIGFGGTGKQMRDALHVDDLYELVRLQLNDPGLHSGQVYNVGGGPENSFSLLELTEACARITGKRVPVGWVPENRPADIRCYVTDNSKIFRAAGWAPKKSGEELLEETARWIRDNQEALRPILGS